MRVLALGLMAEPESGVQDFQTESVGDSLERLRSALDVVGSVPSLTEDAQSVNDSTQELAEVIDNLAVNRDALLVANNDAADLRLRASNISPDSSESRSALSVVQRLWLANNEAESQEALGPVRHSCRRRRRPGSCISGRGHRSVLRSRPAIGADDPSPVPH